LREIIYIGERDELKHLLSRKHNTVEADFVVASEESTYHFIFYVSCCDCTEPTLLRAGRYFVS